MEIGLLLFWHFKKQNIIFRLLFVQFYVSISSVFVNSPPFLCFRSQISSSVSHLFPSNVGIKVGDLFVSSIDGLQFRIDHGIRHNDVVFFSRGCYSGVNNIRLCVGAHYWRERSWRSLTIVVSWIQSCVRFAMMFLWRTLTKSASIITCHTIMSDD